VCTSWTRNGYTFDSCIHNLAGCGTGSALHELWHELGVIPEVPMHAYNEMVRVDRPTGEPRRVHADPEKLERVLLRLSPADASTIAELIDGVRKASRLDMLGLSVATPWERVKALATAIPLFVKVWWHDAREVCPAFQRSVSAAGFPDAYVRLAETIDADAVVVSRGP
jgi:phytoene dehydrogenase-like protein